MKSIALSLFWFLGIGQTKVATAPLQVPTITPTPTIHQLTFEEINQKYGPCTKVNVLMYHHVSEDNLAKKLGQTGLNVSPEWFEKQMQYLKEKQYNVIKIDELVSFIEQQKPIPKKSVVITFDDAYEDNYLNAFPILKKHSFPATIFVPTGLVTVMDYLNWEQIKEMDNSGLIYFGNHTWSHKSSLAAKDILDKEIRLADQQLSEKGLNSGKIFAYPYGKTSDGAEEVLSKYDYSMAFTTRRGNTICARQKYSLPRVRVGNAQLNKYGL